MGSVDKPLTWIDKNIHYVVLSASVLDAVATAYLGFPIIIPAALYTGLCYIVYKAAGIVSEELELMKEENDRRRASRRLLSNPRRLEKRLK